VNEARRALGRRIRRQADACCRLGSPLYARLLEQVARDVETGGPSWKVLQGHDLPPGSSPALRLMGAIHRIVLEGRAPGLARYYPTAAGEAPASVTDAAWGELRAVIEKHSAEIRRRMRDPVQTNEVGRAAALVGGFAMVAATTRLPLRVLEIGASAGLNLRFDNFAYEIDGRLLVDPASPVRFRGVYEAGSPPLDVSMRVVERQGCDIHPLDPTTEEARLRLLSYVWPDQVERVRMLEGALEVARRVPADVEKQSAAPWLRDRSHAKDAEPRPFCFTRSSPST